MVQCHLHHLLKRVTNTPIASMYQRRHFPIPLPEDACQTTVNFHPHQSKFSQKIRRTFYPCPLVTGPGKTVNLVNPDTKTKSVHQLIHLIALEWIFNEHLKKIHYTHTHTHKLYTNVIYKCMYTHIYM